MDSLKQNRNISTATLNDLCNILSCRVEDVLRHIPDKNINDALRALLLTPKRRFYICLLAGVTLILSIYSMYKVLLT